MKKMILTAIIILALPLSLCACNKSANTFVEQQTILMKEYRQMRIVFPTWYMADSNKKYNTEGRPINDIEYDSGISGFSQEWLFYDENAERDIFMYEMITGDDSGLTPGDLFNLLYTEDENVLKEFISLYIWFSENDGNNLLQIIYSDGMYSAYDLYEIHVAPIIQEDEKRLLSLDEEKTVLKWVIENPDYEYAEKNNDYRELLIVLGLLKEE